ncbi:MAG: sulfotransferase [Pseudomonadota bacterium]
MFSLFLLALSRQLSLAGMAVAALFDRRRRWTGRLLLLLLTPVFVATQLITWLFWLLDEILFPRYHDVEIRSPLFVIGPPRTGTTFMHHVLAADENTTTFRLWECLFGVTISGRKICRGLLRLDALTGRIVSRLAARITRGLQSSMDDVHPLGLNDPEEDFLLFLPLASCFLIAVPFPEARWLYAFSRFDNAISARDRSRYLRWYRRCIQKHLYVNGPDARFLSKNASFAGMVNSLLDEFPDARIISTWRDPMEAVPSQLSSLRPGLAALGFTQYDDTFRDALIEQMLFYYQHLSAAEARQPQRIARIDTVAMREQLDRSVSDAFDQLGLEVSASLKAELERRSDASRNHRSSHQYTLQEFGLDEELIRSRFNDVRGDPDTG